MLECLPDVSTARIEKPSDCKVEGNTSFDAMQGNRPARGYDGKGSAARFFYTAKASQQERRGSKHPTIKPISLMRYLVRLVTPPQGIVIDPFAGTGTTGQAALMEGMKYILIEKEDEYIQDIEKRLKETQVKLL